MTWAIPAADTYFRSFLDADPRGFQIDHLTEALKHCGARRTAVDGGAHIGTWSRHLADQFLNVIAFEPAADTYACLVENVKDRGNVTPIHKALGEVIGRAKIVDDPSRPGNTGARHLAAGDSIAVVPLDDYGLQDLDFLKLDVEGFEREAINGAAETLKRCKPVVVIEVKRLRADRDPMLAVQRLNSLGFVEVVKVRNDHIFVYRG